MTLRLTRAALAVVTLLVASGCSASESRPTPTRTEISVVTTSATPEAVPTRAPSPAQLRIPAATARTLALFVYIDGQSETTLHDTSGGEVIITAACTSSSPSSIVETTFTVLRADPNIDDESFADKTALTGPLTCNGKIKQVGYQVEKDRAVQISLGELDGAERAYAIIDKR